MPMWRGLCRPNKTSFNSSTLQNLQQMDIKKENYAIARHAVKAYHGSVATLSFTVAEHVKM